MFFRLWIVSRVLGFGILTQYIVFENISSGSFKFLAGVHVLTCPQQSAPCLNNESRLFYRTKLKTTFYCNGEAHKDVESLWHGAHAPHLFHTLRLLALCVIFTLLETTSCQTKSLQYSVDCRHNLPPVDTVLKTLFELSTLSGLRCSWLKFGFALAAYSGHSETAWVY